MAFFEFFRDGLGFPPLQGGRPNWAGLLRSLGRGLDKVLLRVASVRDEMVPQTCSVEGLAALGQEKSNPRLPGQTDATFRAEVVGAEIIHYSAGRRTGYQRAVRRATEMDFALTCLNREAWHLGKFGLGQQPLGAENGFLVIVDFSDPLPAEALIVVRESVDLMGRAARDRIVYRSPEAAVDFWRVGRPGLGRRRLGPTGVLLTEDFDELLTEDGGTISLTA
ncbi:MAG: hypothetical protein AB1896_19255 [Thermodesulfobacteriota bacterium]